ncbi:MAG: ATP-binding protein [Bacteroidales bacterium]|nr:ATP-binding protein [Bacteroidales bacterium]
MTDYVYLRRKVDGFLKEWKENTNRKPLIIKGARQVGKSESIARFVYSCYKNVVWINFAEMPTYKAITEDGYRPDLIRKNISLRDSSVQFIPGETVIVFDEIQEHPDIATSLKFFNIEGDYDVICSGSMLGINYKKIESNSVGYKEDYDMYSMDFEEFLWARGYKEEIIEDMLNHIIEKRPFSSTEMEVFSSLFYDYFIIGGMPALVRQHVKTKTFEDILNMQRQIIAGYKEDVRKYVEGLEQTRILNVFNRVPIQLGRDNKKFQISKVAHGAKTKDYWGCIEWLADAGVINICYCLNFPELPLKGNYDDTRYKLYFADTGLLIALLDDEAQDDLRNNGNIRTYKGGLFENSIAEALKKAGTYTFYYKRQDSQLEEDFFLRTKSLLVPIEVKSKKGTSQSLRQLIDSPHYPEIAWGIKLSDRNISWAGNILNLPHFCAFLLKRYLSTQE